MWVLVNGFDTTNNIPHDTIQFTQSINDPLPKAQFDIYDPGSLGSYNVGQEVILHDENAVTTQNLAGPSFTPAHNILSTTVWSDAAWLDDGNIIGNGTLSGAGTILTFTFSNNGSGNTTLFSQTIPLGYVHPTQRYMFSVYVQIPSPLVGATALFNLQFQDSGMNTLSGSTQQLAFTSTAGNAQVRLNVIGQAPANAAYIFVNVGGLTTSGTNSGSIIYSTPQLEPMYFASTQGVSYPTQDCNIFQTTCATMPDGTISRATRLFAGFIDQFSLTYDGPNRTWHISCAGTAAMLESGLINATYQAQSDSAIITSVINNNFGGLISINAPNTLAANPIIQGELVDSVSYNDNTLREVMNGLVDNSGFMFYLDPYSRLYYNPSYFNAAMWSLVDDTSADNIQSFYYYDFELQKDATQRKSNIKVIGGKFIAPAITDTFSGNASNKNFTLTQIPYSISTVTVGGVAQKVGVTGRDKNGVSGVQALMDKANQQVVFNAAPPNASNNVVVTYTYEAPVAVLVEDQSVQVSTTVPRYSIPLYQSKVNDTNLISLAAATQRGISELVKWSKPNTLIKLRCRKYAPPGFIVFFTRILDGIINQPFSIQQITGRYLGNGINEFEYQFGNYMPSLIDHIRNSNKAINRSTTTQNVTLPLATDLVLSEVATWGEQILITLQGSNPGNYNSALYGQNTYS